MFSRKKKEQAKKEKKINHKIQLISRIRNETCKVLVLGKIDFLGFIIILTFVL